jgi:signal transduction histidine kinase
MTISSRPARLRGHHPLDFLPLFQRWPRTPFRAIIMTAVLSMAMGGAISLVQVMLSGGGTLRQVVLPMIVIGNLVGFLIHGGLVGMAFLLRGWPLRQTGMVRSVYYTSMVSVLSVLGIEIGNAVLQGRNPLHYLKNYAELAPIVPFALVMSLLMLVLTTAGQYRAQAALQQVRQREEIAATAQLLTEAKLRALQAQIEPHFLYNTLANVLSLIDTQPAQARHMLERFIDFLRASLHASRADSATVGAELDLAAAYLDVLAVRMGQRLQYRIEADDAARAAIIAPMLIQPLVENAVMHGLEPNVAGGTIVVRARVADGNLVVEVADDGVGIGNAPPRTGGGVGMANVKARALSVHGAAAQVQLLDNSGGGAIVRLALPMQSTLIKEPSSTRQPP